MRGLLRSACILVGVMAGPMVGAAPMVVGGELSLFVDHQLIDRLENAQLILGQPQPREVALRFDEPWEKAANYVTVLKDGNIYRMYYRGCAMTPDGEFDPHSEVTCYAESHDGISWTKPKLGLQEFNGRRDNNIILGPNLRRVSHNFAPFLDDRPGVPPTERYKAVGGVFDDNSGQIVARGQRGSSGGLFRYVSADGIHWNPFSDDPIFSGYALDSQNCLAWIPAEGAYAIYLRTWSEGGTPEQPVFRGYRTISRAVSTDFRTWSKPVRMNFGSSPPENLYTNGTHGYFRNPNLLVALAFRFSPERKVVSDADEARFGVHHTQAKGVSDAVFMTSRGGNSYDRTFMESFIRPGLDLRSWTARSNAPALGVVPTGANEMSLYLVTHYTMPDCQLRRFVLRTDGFASIRAPYAGGSALTKPFTFTGNKLVINYSTSSVGSLRVEILSEAGQPLPGFAAQDCQEIVGDELAHTVTWGNRAKVNQLTGRPVRLKFILKDADLYSFQFQP
ncbi:MAG: hypothetical protein ABI222_07385 [Opitutaceae bacterium]